MTSKISLAKLIRENLRRRVWMLALSCLASFMACPVLFLLMIPSSRSYVFRSPEQILVDVLSYLKNCHQIAQLIVLTVGALIVAVEGFSYLFSKSQVDLYHSAPTTRSRIFFANYLTGFLIWFVPFLIGSLFVWGLSLSYVAGSGGAGTVSLLMIKLSGWLILAFLSVYHLCLLAVMFSGSRLPAIINLLILGLIVSAVYLVFYLLFNTCFDTFMDFTLPEQLIVMLSPLISGFAYFYETGSPLYYAVFLLLLVLNLAGAWALYRKRPSELAERGVSNPWFHTPLRLVVSFVGALYGALFFMALSDALFIWGVFGCVLFCVMIFGILDVIYHKSFKGFLSHKLQMALTVIAAVLVFLVFQLDLLGYDSYVPDEKNIVSASLYVPAFQDSSSHYIFQDGYLDYQTVYFTESYQTEDAAALHRLLTDGVQADGSHQIYVDIKLKNGMHFYRHFGLAKTENTMELLRPFIESEDYLNNYYGFYLGNLGVPDYIAVEPLDMPQESSEVSADAPVIRDSGNVEALMAALRQDFLEHSTMEELDLYISVATLTLTYPTSDESRRHVSLQIPESYSATLSLLKQWYPTSVCWEKDDIRPNTLTLDVSVPTAAGTQALYSYFGIDGYPAYEQLLAQFEQENPISEDTDTYSSYSLPELTTEEWSALYGFIHVGDRIAATPMTQDSIGYIYLGRAETTLGGQVDCYIKTGEFPPELIEKLVAN